MLSTVSEPPRAATSDAIVDVSDVVLRDGSTIHLRPTGPGDVEGVAAFLRGLSPDARWFRFLGPGPQEDRAARALVERGTGLVAVAGPEETVVAHASFIPETPDRAELAFAVADAWQGQGIATLLLAHLAQLAEASGIVTFVAWVHPANRRMLHVFRDSGFPIKVRSEPGVLEIELPSQLRQDAIELFEERDRIGAVAAVRHVLEPSSIAVIGASRRGVSVGGTVVRKLVAGAFAGPIYPINPHAKTIAGRRAYPSIADVPGPVDLAVIAVSAPHVVEAARACELKGVRALVVLSAGFGEDGQEGIARQAELLGVCRETGMRLVGPNCLGVLNTAPAVHMDATFAPGSPPAGRIAFASQSGAYGIAALDHAERWGLGLSSFVSMGNKADLSGNDFLRFWEQDPGTDAVLLYLEELGNPQRFGQICRRLTASKPVIVVQSGRSAAGRRAASSHTGALLQASEAAVDALFDHAGVIRVETLDEQLDVAELLAHQPLPRGDRVAIVTNVGGPAISCVDAGMAAGLRVEPLTEDTRRALADHLPPAAALTNPVDMLAAATSADFRRTIETVAADPGVDAIIAIFLQALPGRGPDVVLRAIRAAARRTDLPVLAALMTAQPASATDVEHDVPVYATPEHAARALGHAARFARNRRRRAPDVGPPRRIDSDAAAVLIAEALGAGGGWLGIEETMRLLRAYGVPAAGVHIAGSPHAAGRWAAAAGDDVALKAIVPGLVHRRDAGAIRLGLRGANAVARAARELRSSLEADGNAVEGFVVQAMAPRGVEMLVGVVADPQLGPVVACGAGGTAVELLGDVQVRLAPVAPIEATDMIHGLRTFPLLDGFRGAARADVPALEDIVVRIGWLAANHPEVAELDLNPVIVAPTGAIAVDARVRVERPARRPPYPAVGR
ncbi:MAG TPA: GNAT family N-acetyltransferase [Solirubrobacteraceae bacterium]|nr:GNAT family N-acetyltransferase [Solirubrobacteraceae bacterium]